MKEAEGELVNDPDVQIDRKIIKLAEEYASLDRKSKELSDERKGIRDNVEKLGISTLAWQHAVKLVKHMSEGERRDYQVGMNRVLRVLEERAGDLFPEDVERTEKRVAKAAKIDGAAGAPDPDTNPRSDPKRGGAGKPKTIKEAAAASDAALAEGIAAIEGMASTAPPDVPGEQAEGEAALAAAMPKTKQAQSAKAAEKLAAAKLN